MDESNTLERRYSFNMTQGYPVAESTRHNGISFSWGSSKNSNDYSNSILSLNKTHCSSDCINKSLSIQKSKKTKIDARIATDVQSTGLASRIVKYHENGTRLNRSMSAHNLYSKPGQFPAVTLKKTDLPYRASKQELSMIRIPPPEKSSFYGNTISSLLRSSSVIGLQSKRTEDLSRENRPIIHPPPTDSDMAPTRSVLDVLKEISRKRINSDDLESEEASKKYCNRASYDTIDTIESTSASTSANLNASSLSCQRHKRQRDCMTPCQVVQLSETKTSPEQAKKRVCNYNNDITSSLSSSTKSKIKSALDQTMTTNKESYETQKSKVQRYHDHRERQYSPQVDIRFDNLENALRREDAINCNSPIPEDHCAQDRKNINEIVSTRTESEASYSSNIKNTNLVQPANKPRLTLFNKKYEDSESDRTIEFVAKNTKELIELNDCADIPFVKPKKMTKSGLKNPVMERTQKSKLALMLSGLRGELYQSSRVDELDAPKEKQTPQKLKDEITNAPVSAAVKSNTIPNLTSIGNAEVSTTSNQLNSSSITITTLISSPSSNPSVNKTSSPLVGLKLSQSNLSSERVSNKLTVDAPKFTEIMQSSSCVPSKDGFSFDTTNKISDKIIEDQKQPVKQTSTNLTGSFNIPNFGQSTQITSPLTLDNKANKISENMHLSANKNPLKFPAVCTAFSALTTNTDTYSNMASCSTDSKASTTDSNVIAPSSTSLTYTRVRNNSTVSGTTKPNHAFSFSVPSTSLTTTTTSSMPIMFSNSTSSAFNGKTPLKSIVAASTSATTASSNVTSENLNCLTITPMFTFNSSNKSTTNETTTVSSNGRVLPVAFKFDGNVTATSNPSFGTNANSTINTQPTSLSFTFNTDRKTQSCSSREQNNHKTENQIGNEALQSNASTLFASQCFETKPTGGSTATFSNSSIPIFGSSSVKTGTQSIESSTNNKSEESVTPKVFGSNASPSFGFGLKSDSTPTTNNGNIAPGGFSFNSAVSNNAKTGTFGFESKSSEQVNSSSNIFRSASASAVQNKGFTFGLSKNIPDNPASIFGVAVTKQTENTSPGGFSFGSTTPVKTSTFTFGNKPSGNDVTNGNNPSAGFSFGAPAASKPNEMSTNKPFSFGSQQKQIQSVPTSNANSLNIFGAVTKTAQPPAFNFNSGSSTNLQPNTSTVNNAFALPPSNVTTGPSDRPIRRATRRLQK